MVTRDQNTKAVDPNVTHTPIHSSIHPFFFSWLFLKEAPKGNARRRLSTGPRTTWTCTLQTAFEHFASQKRWCWSDAVVHTVQCRVWDPVSVVVFVGPAQMNTWTWSFPVTQPAICVTFPRLLIHTLSIWPHYIAACAKTRHRLDATDSLLNVFSLLSDPK